MLLREMAKARRVRQTAPSLNILLVCHTRLAACIRSYSVFNLAYTLRDYICLIYSEPIPSCLFISYRQESEPLPNTMGFRRIRILHQPHRLV